VRTNFRLKESVKNKLGTSYMDIGKDSWGNAYQFYAGPLRAAANTVYPFRSYRDPVGDPTLPDDEKIFYYYTPYAKGLLDLQMRGNPNVDGALGFPCDPDLTAYVYSKGGNEEINQLVPWGGDGGDDINNWDHASGWGGFY
jgi:hypothetical protein